MKKAKIMLAAIAVIAVVGGGLAFKAKFTDSLFLYAYTSSNTFALGPQGAAGCFNPTTIDNVVTSPSGTPVSAATTTIVTNLSTVCATKTISQGAE